MPGRLGFIGNTIWCIGLDDEVQMTGVRCDTIAGGNFDQQQDGPQGAARDVRSKGLW
jgi:hypothetical protein